MRQFMIVDAVVYSARFIINHFWSILKMVLVFMAVSIAIGLIFKVSPVDLLSSLSKYLGMPFGIENPILIALPLYFILYSFWNLSFVTYVLSLERTGSAFIVKELKKNLSFRLLKIMLFDFVVVLFSLALVLFLGTVVLSSWWLGGMAMALWLKVFFSGLCATCFVGFIYLLFRLFFTKIIIVDFNADFFTALSVSWSATKSLVSHLVIMTFVVSLLSGTLTIIAMQFLRLIETVSHANMIGLIVGNVFVVFATITNFVFTPVVTLYYYLRLNVSKSLITGR